MGQQLVRVTKEATYGVFPTTPAAGTQVDVFLPMGDDMTVRVQPKFWMVRDAGQGNRLIKKNTGRKDVGGGIMTYLFPSQTPLLMSLLTGLTGTNPCYDIPSFTIDHLVYTDNACAVYGKRYLGCKFTDGTISCDDSDQGCLTTFKGTIVGSTAADITLTDFPNPNLSAYPADDPFLLFHTAENTGTLYIGSARHDYKSLSISVKNMVKAFGGEQRYNQRVGWFGRDITLGTTLLLKSNADRAAYESGTKQAVYVIWDNSTHTFKFDMGTNVVLDSVGDKFPLGDYFTQDLGFSALVDPTIATPTDLTITTT